MEIFLCNLYSSFRIKEADKAYDPPKVKKPTENAPSKKGEAQLTITVIAEN